MTQAALGSSPVAELEGTSWGLNATANKQSSTVLRVHETFVLLGTSPMAGLMSVVRSPSVQVERFSPVEIIDCVEFDGERRQTLMEQRTSGGLFGLIVDANTDHSLCGLVPVTRRGDCEMKLPKSHLAERRAVSLALADLVDSVHPSGVLQHPPASPPGWYADPAGRHAQRYWDGDLWTDHVMDGGVPSVDSIAR